MKMLVYKSAHDPYGHDFVQSAEDELPPWAALVQEIEVQVPEDIKRLGDINEG